MKLQLEMCNEDKEQRDKIECLVWGWSRGVSIRYISEGVTLTLDPEIRSQSWEHFGKSVSGRGNRQCKGPETKINSCQGQKGG